MNMMPTSRDRLSDFFMIYLSVKYKIRGTAG
jgi:hypothetical protein